MGRPGLQLTGKRFGRLTAIEPVGKRGKSILWRCQCDCGKEHIVVGSELMKGNTNSCGCLRLELVKERLKNVSTKTHGESRTRLYRIWSNMKARCSNPNKDHYERYGGRGITVCSEWNSYEVFRNWALDNGYQDSLTLERQNSDGPYSPQNCRWATVKEQASNRCSTRLIEFNGEVHTMKEWAEIVGIKRLTLKHRLDIAHWPIEKALTTPIKGGRR